MYILGVLALQYTIYITYYRPGMLKSNQIWQKFDQLLKLLKGEGSIDEVMILE